MAVEVGGNDFMLRSLTEPLSETFQEWVDPGSINREDINQKAIQEISREMYVQADPNALQRLMMETENLQPILRGAKKDDFIQIAWEAGKSEKENSAALKEKERVRLLELLQTDIKGIYGGRRSTSVSPCPAPFVCSFGTRPREDIDFEQNFVHPDYKDNTENEGIITSQGKHYMNRSHLELIGKLYKAFKRADIADDEAPTTHDIKKTFETDKMVQSIFNLEVIPMNESNTEWDGDQKKKILTCSKEKNSTFKTGSTTFGQQMSKQPTCWENVWSELWRQWKKEDDDDWQEDVVVTKLQKSFFHDTWIEIKRTLSQLKTKIIQDLQFTPKSQIKFNAMLTQLKQLESEYISRLSIRAFDNTKIEFPTYCAAFGPFVGDSDWKTTTGLDEPRPVFDEAQHRLLGPSISERFARDGYLGTNLAPYEVVLPGRLTPPLTIRMEAPSCALAPRNRGGLPRMITPEFMEDKAMTELEGKKLKQKELSTNKVLSRILVDTARYRAEERKLRTSISDFHEERFDRNEVPQRPALELLEPIHPSSKQVDHLWKLREESGLTGSGQDFPIFGTIDLREMPESQIPAASSAMAPATTTRSTDRKSPSMGKSLYGMENIPWDQRFLGSSLSDTSMKDSPTFSEARPQRWSLDSDVTEDYDLTRGMSSASMAPPKTLHSILKVDKSVEKKGNVKFVEHPKTKRYTLLRDEESEMEAFQKYAKEDQQRREDLLKTFREDDNILNLTRSRTMQNLFQEDKSYENTFLR